MNDGVRSLLDTDVLDDAMDGRRLDDSVELRVGARDSDSGVDADMDRLECDANMLAIEWLNLPRDVLFPVSFRVIDPADTASLLGAS